MRVLKQKIFIYWVLKQGPSLGGLTLFLTKKHTRGYCKMKIGILCSKTRKKAFPFFCSLSTCHLVLLFNISSLRPRDKETLLAPTCDRQRVPPGAYWPFCHHAQAQVRVAG